MIITFNELRRIKDRLPSGSSQRIADELGISVETVRNYFGGSHEAKEVRRHFIEPGPDGGVVTLDDTTILDVAMRIFERAAAIRIHVWSGFGPGGAGRKGGIFVRTAFRRTPLFRGGRILIAMAGRAAGAMSLW